MNNKDREALIAGLRDVEKHLRDHIDSRLQGLGPLIKREVETQISEFGWAALNKVVEEAVGQKVIVEVELRQPNPPMEALG